MLVGAAKIVFLFVDAVHLNESENEFVLGVH
jgi:hypothetical protein